MKRNYGIITALLGLIIILITSSIYAGGPPWRTDDPEPVPFKHGEIYLFSTGVFDAGGANGIGPALELNYGPFPDTQFHLILPLAYTVPKNETSYLGYGDTEVGIKYRFVEQTDVLPDIGTFPIAEIATGNQSRGLGNGKAQFYLPVWLQKDIGKWSIDAGGGYWINPGVDNKNWAFSGLQIQYNFTDDFFLGAEIFHQTPSTIHSGDNTGIHFGGGIPVIKNYQILFSGDLGNGITSYKHFAYYLGLYHTF
jgi:hypothetical protein